MCPASLGPEKWRIRTMRTQENTKTPIFESNIPVLDREFDLDSPGLSDFVLLYLEAEEDRYIMRFNEKPDDE